MKMKILKISGIATVFALLAGCIVQSVYPFYMAKDLTFEPALVGRWSENVTNPAPYWEFKPAGDQAYVLTTVDTQETNCFETHLFHLKQFQFLDLRTTNVGEFQMPLHIVMKVSSFAPTLKMSVLNYDWLKKLVEKNPAAIRHIVVPENSTATNGDTMIYLTADTKELQKFILKYVNDTNAFADYEQLTRLPQ
jgi:hypothetical protein